MILIECLKLFYTFFKIGLVGFGGGYAMISMIIYEAGKYSVTLSQIADLNALDMIVPGPLAINAATYVGYLHQGALGAFFATLGVSLPSFILVALVLRFLDRYRENRLMNGILLGVKPAAVGLIAAASITIASGALMPESSTFSQLLADPINHLSLPGLLIFIAAAVANIVFEVNPILLTVIAGVLGAFLL